MSERTIRVLESSFVTSAVDRRGYPADDRLDIAFAGRSNVGKSSMINTLLGRKLLARVSGSPGKTRLINFLLARYRVLPEGFERELHFVDLPGYGYARVGQDEREKWRRMMDEYFTRRKRLRGVVVLVDIRHPADPKDIVLLDMLSQYHYPVLVAATKSDKLPKNRIAATLRELRAGLGHAGEILPFSSLAKTGGEAVWEWMERVLPEPSSTPPEIPGESE